MSWSEGRSASSTGNSSIHHDALERVHGILRRLAKDKFLHEDLQHPDVQKALHHWTGHSRLAEDEADELMEDNYRVQAVFSKVAELQACCKVVGIAFPLQQVISGTGLYSDNSDTSTIYARAKTVDINTERAGISSSIHHRSGGKYSDMAVNSNRGNAVVTGKEDEEQQNRSTARNVPMERSGDANTVKRPDEMTWQQAIVEELWKVVVIGVCAFLFSFGLKYFRGENPLGAPEDVQRATASDGTDEL